MIISRTPFRVSFAGGGSDLPAFYTQHEGCVISTTIDKYMYISIHPTFQMRKTVLKYSQTEVVDNIDTIKHRYYRAALKKYGVSGVEINSLADIPSGTGLGSSSSFSAGLINCLHAYRGEYISREKLAEETCELEIDDCGQPIGKQDQYAASYGGFNFYTFNKDGSVDVEPVIMPASTLGEMQNRLRLFYIGGVHSASDILRKQGGNVSHDKEKAEAQMKICDLANELREELQKGNIDVLGKILHENWTLKRTLADGVSNTSIDAYYQKALDLGALGGKILGAGGCGFLLLYTPPEKQETVTAELGLPQVKFGFDRQGSTIIYDTNNEGGSEPQRSN